jgi:hypothetical protein
VTEADVEEVLGIVLLYVPPSPARQMFGEVLRSRAAKTDAHLRECARELIEALAMRQGGYSR